MKKLYTLTIFSLAVIIATAQNPWTQKANMSVGRWQAFGFSIGTKGYVGSGAGSSDLNDFWEWDQSSNTWTQKANFPQADFDNAVGFSLNGKGYAGTGQSLSSVINLFYEYDPSLNSWTQKANVGSTTRKEAVGLVVGGIGFIGTGCNVTQSAFYQDFWQYNAGPNTWTQKANFTGSARYGAFAFAIGNFGYIGGGTGATGNVQDFYEYNQTSNTWTQKANYPVATANYNGVGFSDGTNGFVLDGSWSQNFYQWNQSTNTWKKMTNFTGVGRDRAIAFSIGSKGYIGTGRSSTSTKLNDLWEYDPSKDCKNIIASSFTASSYTVNSGSAVTFTNGSTGATTYNWLNNGNSFSTSTNPIYTYTTSGTFSVSLVAINGGCTDTSKQIITVTCSVISNFTASSYTVTQGDTVIFTNTSSGASSYTWQLNGNTFSTSTNTTDTFPTAGTFTISLIASNGNCSTTHNVIIIVNPCVEWFQKASMSATQRGKAVAFSIGTKGYVGTGRYGNYFNDFWEWDQSTNVWTQKANFGGAARYGAVGFSIGTKGYIGTGYDGTNYYNDFWEWDQSSNIWTQKANFGGVARQTAVGFSIGSKGYIGTGQNPSNWSNDFWEYNPSSDTWVQKTNFGGAARENAVGFTIGSKGYIGTGYHGSPSTKYDDFWQYDPSTNAWLQKANCGGGTRYGGTGFSIGSKGYIGTGWPGVQDFWEYDTITNVWTQRTNFGGGVRAESAGFSIGTKGYVCSGGGPTTVSDLWEYDRCNSITIPTGIIISETNSLEAIQIFPNPSSGHFTLQSSVQKGEITIYNVQGEKIYSAKINSSQSEIDLSKQSQGIYFIKVNSEQGVITKKIIIQ